MRITRYRVQNFRNIDDSGWIPIEAVTAFVGRNESGKTALLKALHKFNPATPEPYQPQREFPRDRYTRDFRNPADWPVCSVAFAIERPIKDQIASALGSAPPNEAICVRHYDQSLKVSYEPAISEPSLDPAPILKSLKTFASGARRLSQPPADPSVTTTEAATAAQDQTIQQLRTELAQWATAWSERLQEVQNLRTEAGAALLGTLRSESDTKANPLTADLAETLQEAIDPVLAAARQPPVLGVINDIIEKHLPVFIYFENYGILDSAIYLPRFLEDLQSAPSDPRVRTVNAMFKHVRLTAKEIADLGREQAGQVRAQGQQVTRAVIAQDQERKEARAIKLNSASLDITTRFNEWYQQRRHAIEYQADGDYFRIWIADDRRPGVKIELEGRSKGFQWFFSFYLVFLVESEEGHKDAVLLLDEPGLNLHPTAQEGLIAFFENLAEKNQLIYTTHSPFLIDGEHIHRVRPVTEDSTGHSHITAETWPADRETIFPLQAAAGYAMVRGLFQHRDNVLVEGMSDYYYLHALSQQCRSTGRPALPDDIYITPCGGTKLVGNIASLFLGQKVRPLVLLDGDDAARVRQNQLIKELYAGHHAWILMLDEALERPGTEVEIEDILGETLIVPAVSTVIGRELALDDADRASGSLPTQIKIAAERQSIGLPDGWKASAALQLVSTWAQQGTVLPHEVLDRAARLFVVINERFEEARSKEGNPR